MTKRFAGEWLDYRMRVIPRGAPDVQVTETRRAFYAGAQSVIYLIINLLDPEHEEISEAETRMANELLAELRDFWNDVKEGVA